MKMSAPRNTSQLVIYCALTPTHPHHTHTHTAHTHTHPVSKPDKLDLWIKDQLGKSRAVFNIDSIAM